MNVKEAELSVIYDTKVAKQGAKELLRVLKENHEKESIKAGSQPPNKT